MDVHKKSWTCHFKTDLFDHKTVTMPADPGCLEDYVLKNFPDHEVNCCYEAGCCGYWIARSLQQLNWNVLVVNPADVPRTSKQNWQKTDKIDCRNLCDHLRKNNLHSIYIPEEELGIRIENDILITEKGPVDLMAKIPVEADEIEELMARKEQRVES